MFQFFVIFHKYIFDDCYKNIPQNILDTYFTFIAANPDIEKHYTQGKYRIINEWELPTYDPSLQKDGGYVDNGVIKHVYLNNLHTGYDHVGFLQYDMMLPADFIERIQDGLDKNPTSLGYCIYKDTYDFLVGSCNKIIMDNVVEDYEYFFNQKFSANKLYPICNTYIITVETFEIIMPWMCQIFDKCVDLCKIHYPATKYKGVVLERAMAIAVGEFVPQLDVIDIIHDRELNLKSN